MQLMQLDQPITEIDHTLMTIDNVDTQDTDENSADSSIGVYF